MRVVQKQAVRLTEVEQAQPHARVSGEDDWAHSTPKQAIASSLRRMQHRGLPAWRPHPYYAYWDYPPLTGSWV